MPASRRLSAGKVPAQVLRRCVLPFLGSPSGRVLRGAGVGEDAPIIDMGDRVLVVKANPITGADANLGREVVHINANDVAARGARPLWFMNILILPVGTPERRLAAIAGEVDEACRSLGVSLIGGHTECTPGITRPVAAGFMIGEAAKGRYVTGDGARPGDRIILTKGAGIEGTAILASDFREKLRGKVPAKTLREAEKYIDRISVVAEALAAVEAGGVHSMHTPTEGGVLNGLAELAGAAGVGLIIEEALISVEPTTQAVCDALGVDPLRLISSGSLLLSADPAKSRGVLEAIRGLGVAASDIGEVTPAEEGTTLIKKNGRRAKIRPVRQDELFRLLATSGT